MQNIWWISLGNLTLVEFEEKIRKTKACYPYIVCLEGDKIIGYEEVARFKKVGKKFDRWYEFVAFKATTFKWACCILISDKGKKLNNFFSKIIKNSIYGYYIENMM